MGQTHTHKKNWFCSESLVWLDMFDHFCLDMVGLVLSEFVWSGLVGLSQKKDNNGLKYRVAVQLKIPVSIE